VTDTSLLLDIDKRIRQLENHLHEGLPPWDKLYVPEGTKEEAVVRATIMMDGIILEAAKSHKLTREV